MKTKKELSLDAQIKVSVKDGFIVWSDGLIEVSEQLDETKHAFFIRVLEDYEAGKASVLATLRSLCSDKPFLSEKKKELPKYTKHN